MIPGSKNFQKRIDMTEVEYGFNYIILLTYQCRHVSIFNFNLIFCPTSKLIFIFINMTYEELERSCQCLTKSIHHSLKQSPTYARRSAHVLCRHVLFIAFDCKIIGEEFSVDTLTTIMTVNLVSFIRFYLIPPNEFACFPKFVDSMTF